MQERARLDALLDYRVLDTLPTEAFDRITSLAADLFDAPIALVSLVDSERQWFKSHHGLEATSTPRSWAFCSHAIEGKPRSTLVVEDATLDQRFAANPLVVGDPGIRFYAGAVLTSPEGANLGTLCIIDSVARAAPSERALHRLRNLADMVVDELELHRVRNRSKAKRQLLSLAERMSGVGHWRYDLADGKISWSDETFRIHGISPEHGEPEYGELLKLYREPYRTQLASAVDLAVTTGKSYSLEGQVTRPNGEVRSVITKADCLFDAAGEIEALCGVFQDVTDRRNTDYFTSTLVDNIPIDLSYWDVNGRCRFANRPWLEKHGLTADTAIGAMAQDIVASDYFNDSVAQAKWSLDGQSVSFERTLITKTGETRHEMAHYIPHRNPDGVICGIYSIATDIGEMKNTETQLRHAMAAAETANEAKSVFLATMSHEIRTPLNGVLGMAQAMTVEPLPPKQRQRLETIIHSGQNLASILNDVLDMAKIEVGKIVLEDIEFNLEALIESSHSTFTLLTEEKGLTFSANVSPQVEGYWRGDPGRLRQILQNIISNAVKFTDDGGVTLTVDRDDQAIVMNVTDTGIGISPDQLDGIFRRFVQAEASTTRRYGGTGLGLAISRELAELMGGTLDARSELGRGSTFTLRIPLTYVGADERTLAQAATQPTVEQADRDLRVLAAEDNSVNRLVLSTLLEQFGITPVIVNDGAMALEAWRANSWDLILMDIQMPVMDGLTATKAIRAEEARTARRRTPVVAVTANAMAHQVAEYDAAGFDGYLAKPLVIGDLYDTISTLIVTMDADTSPAIPDRIGQLG